MNDNMSEAFANATNKLVAALEAHSPEVTRAILEAARMEALGNVLKNWSLLVVGVLLAGAAVLLWKRPYLEEPNGNEFPGFQILGCILGLFSVILLMTSMGELLYPANWVGIWHPEVYLASKVLP